jgi:Domain of unknown function (DUF4157)
MLLKEQCRASAIIGETMSWVDDVGNAIEDAVSNAARTAGDTKKVVEVQVAIATQPTEILVDPATGQPLDQSAKDLVTAVAGGTSAVATQATIPDVFMIDLASGVAGDAGTKIAEVATAGRAYSIDIMAAMPALLNKPTPPTPEEVAAAPLSVLLAAAITTAAEQLRGSAKEVPKLVRLALQRHFPPEILSTAQYTVGKIGITLPEVINGAQSFMGNHAHGVTVDNVIVFSTEPNQTDQSALWWAHELQHVVQYANMGVAEFASRYITACTAIEKEAEDKARDVQAEL